MNAMIKQAIDHWCFVSPLLTTPETKENFDALVEALDELLDIVEDNEAHPLIGLVHQLGNSVTEYEDQYLPIPQGNGRTALKFLVEQYNLSQSDLPEVATQSVISEILSGKRQLTIRHIKALSVRFNVSANTFF